MCLDRLAERLRQKSTPQLTFRESTNGQPLSLVADHANALLLKPQTFINLSGSAVRACMLREHFKPEQLIVVHDDLQLALGTMKLKQVGSAAGHNGVDNIFRLVQGAEAHCSRLRLGVGPLPFGVARKDFVLQRFRPTEQAQLDAMLELAVRCLMTILESGNVGKAMTLFNNIQDSERIQRRQPI
jgi:PTH1 family peptidyl-tRNA hydrolase